MISIPLWKRELKANYKILLIFTAVLAMYGICMVYMFDPALGKMLDEFSRTMPQLMAAFGMSQSGRNLTEFLANYLYGFLLLVFPMIFEIILTNRIIAKYVDSGAMGYLLATPNTRRKIAVTQAFVAFGGVLLLLLFNALFVMLCSAAMFPGELDYGSFFMINVGVFCLHLAISGFCYFASCLSNDTKLSYSIGAGAMIGFYLIKMLANVGGKLENLKYATIFTMFQPDKIIAGETQAYVMIGILAAIGVFFYILGCFVFTRKDLPV